MRLGKTLGLWLLLAAFTLPSAARAEQASDWIMSGPGAEGSFVNLDVIFGAVQAGIENRKYIFGQANELTLRASAIAAIPFGSTQLDADLRILILTLGTSVGAADSWRNQTYASGAINTRKERRQREASGEFNSETFGFWEGRLGLDLPFNDYVLLHSVNGYRISGAPERSFDNLISVAHDGDYFRSDTQLYFKHRSFGGLGPMAEVLNFAYDGTRHTQLNVGFSYVSRAGLVRRDDILLVQMLFNVGDTLGGYDNSDSYGLAILRGPATLTLAYRSVIEL